MKKIIILLLTFFLLATVGAQSLQIVRGDGKYAPYEWEEDGVLKGIHVELVEEAAKRAGIDVNIKSLPWTRAVAEVESGNVDGITYMSFNVERENFALFDERNILSLVKYILVVKKGNNVGYNGNITDLQGKKIGVLRGYFYGGTYDENTKMFKKDISQTLEISLRKLVAGRVDAVISSLDDFNSAKGTDLFDQVEVLTPEYDVNPVYLAFSKKKTDKALVEKFANSMKEVKASPFYKALLNKYDQ